MENQNKKLLLLNAGSSSLKFQIVKYDNLDLIAQGICEAIGSEIGKFKIIYGAKHDFKSIKFNDFKHAINFLLNFLEDHKIIKSEHEIAAIGHRVVHDGSQTKGTAIIDLDLIKIIDKYAKFAPLHNPFELEVIKITRSMFPKAIQIACFDTGFHHTIPKENFMYGIKKEWYEKYNIRKFNFHGLSYEYINLKMQVILNKQKNNLVVCHLGSGCSICTIKDSKSFNGTMGFSTYDGLIMATRVGDVSPSVMSFLSNQLKVSADKISNLFLKECGLKGLTQETGDMSLIEQNLTNEDYKLAFDLFVNKIVDYICIAINKLENKVDGIIFTGGIGENSALVRKSVIDKIKICNFKLDNSHNESKIYDYCLISDKKSQIPIYVIKTNEEYIIAKNIKQMLENNK